MKKLIQNWKTVVIETDDTELYKEDSGAYVTNVISQYMKRSENILTYANQSTSTGNT